MLHHLSRYQGRQQAAKILMIQLFISLLITLAFGIGQGFASAYAACWGGLTCIAANFFFFHQAFKVSGALAAQRMMRGFVFGQMGKFTITVVLFALAFIAGQVKPMPLFLGYIFTTAGFWLAPLLLKTRETVNE